MRTKLAAGALVVGFVLAGCGGNGTRTTTPTDIRIQAAVSAADTSGQWTTVHTPQGHITQASGFYEHGGKQATVMIYWYDSPAAASDALAAGVGGHQNGNLVVTVTPEADPAVALAVAKEA